MSSERTIYVHARHKTPLALRARFEWTFFGLGLFAAINLFLIGSFLLMEAIRNPIAASASVIVAAAFMLALAIYLLAYLAWPRFKVAFGTPPYERRHNTFSGPVLTVYTDNDAALQTQIEEEQALALRRQFAPGADRSEVRRAPERTDSAPRSGYDDAARARQ